MALDNCAFDSGDVAGNGVTFLTFLENRPNEDERLPERMIPNQLLGWHNGAQNIVELWVVSSDGWRLERCASGLTGSVNG